jgi:hypothetical protein
MAGSALEPAMTNGLKLIAKPVSPPPDLTRQSFWFWLKLSFARPSFLKLKAKVNRDSSSKVFFQLLVKAGGQTIEVFETNRV